MFQLPEEIIPLDVLHQIDHKTPQSLKTPVLNTKKHKLQFSQSPIATLIPAGKCKQVWEIKWSILQNAKQSAVLEVSQDPQTKESLEKAHLLPHKTQAPLIYN